MTSLTLIGSRHGLESVLPPVDETLIGVVRPEREGPDFSGAGRSTDFCVIGSKPNLRLAGLEFYFRNAQTLFIKTTQKHQLYHLLKIHCSWVYELKGKMI